MMNYAVTHLCVIIRVVEEGDMTEKDEDDEDGIHCLKSVDGPHDSSSSQENDCLAFIV